MTALDIENLLEELEELLDKHNWHYMFETDGDRWNAGYTESVEISNRMKQLRDLGFSEKADALYISKRPHHGTTA